MAFDSDFAFRVLMLTRFPRNFQCREGINRQATVDRDTTQDF